MSVTAVIVHVEGRVAAVIVSSQRYIAYHEGTSVSAQRCSAGISTTKKVQKLTDKHRYAEESSTKE